ncbi:MAG: Protease 3 [Chlamydiae bacterium]|nr:Protease 3 [Chlamydiota bacterium]
MRYLTLTFILAASLIWAESSQDFERIRDQNPLTIKTPSLSSRKTAKIRLSNGLEAYLISDPNADQSAASLAMHVGSWSDSPDYPGIAHFLEHLLFMGSEAYPEESAYLKQIWDNGGSLNAYTANDRTVYTFSVNNDAFPTTLDMFSHMFIDPLFNPSGITRELHAVDQEHDKNIENDGYRLWMVLKETANPAHPVTRFNSGNSVTLGGIPRAEVKRWHQAHYSSDRAHLVIYSTLPLEELEILTVRYFSAVPMRSVPALELKESLLSSAQVGHIVAIEPIKDLRNLSIGWELPSDYISDLDDRSDSLLGYILGGKQESSLYAQLKKEELVEDISAGMYKISNESGMFFIDLDLTPRGAVHYEEVIERCFQTLNNLKQRGVPPYIYNEMKRMASIDYEYQSRRSPYQFVEGYASGMVYEPLETFPHKSLIPTKFDPAEISAFLNHLTPESAVYLLMASPKLSAIPSEKTERWSGARYATRKISAESLAAWSEADPHKDIALPSQNQFIPRDLQLVTHREETQQLVTPIPTLLTESEQGRVFFWEDSQYQVPKIAWIFNIHTPLIDGSSRSSVLIDLYQFALYEKMADTLSYAAAASLYARTRVSDLKFILSINGYSEKAPLLLETILTDIKTLKITREEFDLYRGSLESSYANMKRAIPISQAQERLLSITTNNHPMHDEQLAALSEISYEEFLGFSEKLFEVAYVEAMVSGNMREKDGQELWKSITSQLAFTPYPVEEHEKKQMLILSPFQGPYKVQSAIDSLGSAAILLLQEGPSTFPKLAVAKVLGAALQDDFFNTLRTKQQTGYITKTFAIEEEEQLYSLFMVQSTTHQGDELIARFELFLEGYVKDFESMISEGRFEVIRDNQITLLTTPPTNLHQMANHLNKLAFSHNGEFDRLEKSSAALRALTYEELKKETATFLSRRNSKRIAIIVDGRQPEEKAFRYENVTAETLKSEGTYISLP